MKNAGEHLSKLRLIVRELGRIPEYHEEAGRLHRQLRAFVARPAAVVDLDQSPRPERRHRRRVALAGLAALTVTWYLAVAAAANAAAIR